MLNHYLSIFQNVHPTFKIHSAAHYGSHVYGLNSTASDNDVQIIYSRPFLNYQSLFTHSDISSFKVENDKWTFSCWDLSKFLGLLYKGNAQPYEMMTASSNERLRNFTFEQSALRMNAMAKHYYGLAHNDMKDFKRTVGDLSKRKTNLKHLLHISRCLMTMQHIRMFADSKFISAEEKLPSVNYKRLLNLHGTSLFGPETREELEELMNAKIHNTDWAFSSNAFSVLDSTLEDFRLTLDSFVIDDIDNKQEFDAFFINMI